MAWPILILFDGIVDDAAFAAIGDPIRLSGVGDIDAFVTARGAEIQVIACLGSAPLPSVLRDGLPHLRLIACLGAGHDGIDLGWARSRGIAVTCGRGVNSDDVADVAVGLCIDAVRGLSRGDRLIRADGWTRPLPLGLRRSLGGLDVGVVGLGAIGSAFAVRMAPMVRSVRWWGPRVKPDVPWPRSASLRDLAVQSDLLCVTCALTPATRGLVDAGILAALGAGGYLVNVARGEIVDEDALIAALRDQRIAGAATDVFAAEPTPVARWADLDNIVLTPHIASATTDALARAGALMVANIAAFADGHTLLTEVEG